jgi:hypothetical protein
MFVRPVFLFRSTENKFECNLHPIFQSLTMIVSDCEWSWGSKSGIVDKTAIGEGVEKIDQFHFFFFGEYNFLSQSRI